MAERISSIKVSKNDYLELVTEYDNGTNKSNIVKVDYVDQLSANTAHMCNIDLEDRRGRVEIAYSQKREGSVPVTGRLITSGYLEGKSVVVPEVLEIDNWREGKKKTTIKSVEKPDANFGYDGLLKLDRLHG